MQRNIKPSTGQYVKENYGLLVNAVKKFTKDISSNHLITSFGIPSGIAGEEENVAVFLDYTYNELKDMLNRPYNRDNGALIIDYSESLMEGGAFIAEGHMHKESPEEAMLVTVEHMLFLLERINKLYIAYQAEFHDYTNVAQLKQAVKEFDADLSKVNAYRNYSDKVLKSRDKLNDFWPVAQELFADVQRATLPVIVLASAEKLQNELENLDDFHHKAANK
ncbi:MAG: hypothetical protein V2I50_00640 [Desulfuromusa sp.]|nr:hypothetical protein [Desulfuromusa sp.]